MTTTYHSIITNNGLLKNSEAAPNNVNLNLTEIAVCNSNGVDYDPDGTEIGLVNELYRTTLTHVVIDDNNQNQLIIEGVIDEEIGPFYVREVGIFDSDGDLFAIGKFPETFKSNLPSGVGKKLYIRMILGFANTPNVTIVASDVNNDPNFSSYVSSELNNRLKISENLGDLDNVETARNNLEVYSKAETDDIILNKNYVINGNFDIWQRGILFNSNSSITFCADRWQYKHDATGSGTVERNEFAVDQNEVPNNPRYFLRHNQITAPTTSSLWFLRYYVEDVRSLAGKNVTLSFYIKADKNIAASCLFRNSFGNSNYSNITQSNFNITTSWQKIVLNNSYPVIPAGMTIESNSSNQFIFEIPADVCVIDIAQVQLEEGNIASNFQYRPIKEEISLCHRYYQKTFLPEIAPANNAGLSNSLCVRSVSNSGNSNLSVMWEFSTKMRATPSITRYNPGSGTSGYWFTNDDNTSIQSGIESNSGTDRVTIQHTAASANPYKDYYIHATADAEL